MDQEAAALFPGAPPIVWECDARTFTFGYVGRRAVDILGYPTEKWREPGFWAQHVVHADDHDDAVSYCALATDKAQDHVFEYRARAADGRLVWLCDYVKVVRDERGQAVRLRGAMVDVSADKAATGATTNR